MIILVCYDISGFFDKEVLADVVVELHSIGVGPKGRMTLLQIERGHQGEGQNRVW